MTNVGQLSIFQRTNQWLRDGEMDARLIDLRKAKELAKIFTIYNITWFGAQYFDQYTVLNKRTHRKLPWFLCWFFHKTFFQFFDTKQEVNFKSTCFKSSNLKVLWLWIFSKSRNWRFFDSGNSLLIKARTRGYNKVKDHPPLVPTLNTATMLGMELGRYNQFWLWELN